MFGMVQLRRLYFTEVFLYEEMNVMQIGHLCEIRQEIYFIEFDLLDLDYL